jgi:hypothetical protein
MDRHRESNLAECRLLEESGSVDVCMDRFPELKEELLAHWALIHDLTAMAPSQPAPQVSAAGRRLLLSSLESPSTEDTFMPWAPLIKFAAPLLGLILLGGVALGAGAGSRQGGDGTAAGGFLRPGKNGTEDELPANSQGTDQKHKKGIALLEATVTGTVSATATGTGTVVPPATGTPQATATASVTGTAIAGASTPVATGTPRNHGQAVSQAVHEAQENGDPVGPAACAAAHDASTLPENAQNAPGHQKEKDCAKGHEEADDEEDEEGDDSGSGTSVTPTPTVGTASAPANNGNGGGRQDKEDKKENKQSSPTIGTNNAPAPPTNRNGNGHGQAGGNTNPVVQPGRGNGNGQGATGGSNANGGHTGNSGGGNPGKGKR